ncbi:MAG: type II toxin-antitoxin system death-on-curing family toxin [Cyanobacteria bacterium HKST-UBA02]|nr:type II toxin-antitoxin system death-on-curing family toxin [Cyanobacteria bacterium HKST-UBA02]
MVTIVFLSRPEVESLHDEQIELYGGNPGVQDENMLESAIAAPKATYDGRFLYKSIHEMAACYFFGLANNHGFYNANKRTAAIATYVFYQVNGWELEIDNEELVEFAVQVVTEKTTRQEITEFFEKHTTEVLVAES